VTSGLLGYQALESESVQFRALDFAMYFVLIKERICRISIIICDILYKFRNILGANQTYHDHRITRFQFARDRKNESVRLKLRRPDIALRTDLSRGTTT
jgi:hypothetical protein